MFQRKSQILALIFLAGDLALTVVAWIAAYFIRFDVELVPIRAPRSSFAECCGMIPLVVVMSALAYHFTGQYVIHRFRRLREEAVAVVKGAALMGLLVIAGTFGLQSHYVSRATFLIFLALTAPLLLCVRRLNWLLIHWLLSHGFHQTQAIIVGTGRVARKTACGLQSAGWLGIRTVGFVEDQPSRWTDDVLVLGGIRDLPRLVSEFQVSHVFICLPMSRYHEARRVFDTLSQTLVDVRLLADVPALAGLSFTTTYFEGMPMVGLRESPHFGLNIIVKRAMDIMLSMFALVVLAPLLTLIAALIKCTSSGPVLYRQERCGLSGRSFWMLKFRSMNVDAEQQTGAVWADKNDSRRTWLGAFLRKTSLDELPQLINVLKGDMSLVGPRPERPVFINQFAKSIPNYCARHAVKAGMTGWAQVHGWRGNTSLRKRIQFDLYYITHWTPWLDLRILWMTVWHGLVNRNAY